MKLLRKIRDGLGRIEVLLFSTAAVSGVYLAAATVLSGTEYPSEELWEPWKVLFVLMLVAAVFVPVYGFYKALDAYFQAADKESAERSSQIRKLQRDLEVVCQRTVAAIADGCAEVAPNDLCVRVWLCKADDTFDERAFFYLPDDEVLDTGVKWRKGKGISGTVWEQGKPKGANLGPLNDQLKEMGDSAFDRLDASERWGMEATDVEKTSRYTGVCAFPLFQRGDGRILGVFIVDYVGERHFHCVETWASKRPVSNYVAGCAGILTDAKSILPD